TARADSDQELTRDFFRGARTGRAGRAAWALIDGEERPGENDGEEGSMKFVQGEGVWQLIDETAPRGARGLATLRSGGRWLTRREFCQFYLQAADRIPEHLPIRHGGADYTVTPLGAPGEKLALVIRGDGYSSTVATQFDVPGTGANGR